MAKKIKETYVLFAIPSFGDQTPYDGLTDFERDMDGNWDFAIIHEDGKYYMEFETLISWDNPDGCRKYLEWILESVNAWMNKHNKKTTTVLSLYDLFTTGYNVNSRFDELETLYATLKVLINGFEGHILFNKGE